MEYTISVDLEKNEEFFDFLHQGIKEYNNIHSVNHAQIRKPDAIQSLHLIVKGADGQYLGGLACEMYWGWLDIQKFYLREDCRKLGIGTKVIKQAEEIAKAAGCTKAFLTTFEFQARKFYERFGYRVTGKLEGYPPGSVYYWMVKELD